MIAEIVSIGDEILIGQIVNTNAVFIAKELNKIGIEVGQITSISDRKEHIESCLDDAQKRAQVIILTGGLGPTKDDLTKHTLCSYFDDVLVKNQVVLDRIEEMFAKYVPTPINDENRKQALLPSKAKVLNNFFGTASGMWFEIDNKVVISLPGVPFEMKALISNEVIPALQKHYTRPFIIHKTLLTYGLGESVIAERIELWENELPKDIKLAYLPNLGRVRLRLSGKGTDENLLNNRIDAEIEKLYPLIGDIIMGFEEEASIEEQLQAQFIKTNNSLAIAESCTGGKIASRLTQIPGASSYFKGCVVAYATEVKVNLLGVSKGLIDNFSVVSAPVAEAMAVGVRERFGSTIGVSTTGNAGPSKGDSDADLGTVFIAVSSVSGVVSYELHLGKHRERVVEKAINKAMELLHKEVF
ncbi:MAG: competence/damage-inducible protein A [Flavobacteriales bacterium]|jgi:nicotinamide-nucleotide amidase|nr:competence/damage-inducible protein A [Flavobacteriaceae bacterium]MDO7592343.1 competence/damage-inducible protein A [Flavobacteriaceae bacterium]MDO7599256.1 competence/damage-inducible protein A [Flavobacteriaceae bacterium]MDO7603427.1 competence/damage-inducible protein A [Flavobacteriaceae bacterium]MDO7615364.1 competence/damage-inducible protein A [Flavobacteriaceae bacterium]|tara:strand:- start:464 stop:1705 length:1242 start_codon:yes stop_codon:yes gene_type:complete